MGELEQPHAESRPMPDFPSPHRSETMTASRITNPESRLHDDKILILDFGAQYTQLIARRIRELGVYCEIWAWDHNPDEIAAFGAKGIVLSGGPESTTMQDAPKAPQQVFDANVPILGICYGMQTMAAQLGGSTEAAEAREFGYAEVDITPESKIFADLSDHDDKHRLDVWMSHGDHVATAPPGFVVTGTTDRIPVAVMENPDKQWYGVQFHPEVTHTKQGGALLKRFIADICGCATLWTAANIIDDQIERVRAQVGDDHVLLGLSGGVDSSVVAALLHRAIGDRLTCVFVDTGLLRWKEGDQVMATMAESSEHGMGIKVIRVNAADRYFQSLAGVSDPEAKRKIIGGLFVEIFDEESEKLIAAGGNVKWLAQGTIYPDVIESAGSKTGKAHVIKSHHNVGGLPEHMKLKLVEPLRELFKDEVRRIGVALGLPKAMVYRHPFPGPGLGVRILGEVKREYATLLAQADAIFIDELRKADLYDKTSQAFAVFLPVKSVGVVGDARAYEWVIALRAVETIDFMTAQWAHLPYEFLGKVSNRIINELRGVSRVVYDISGKPPATIEWE